MNLLKYAYYLRSILTLLQGVRPRGSVIKLFLARKPEQKPVFFLPHSDLYFRVRTRMDLWSVKEAVLDGFYEQCGFPLLDNWIVVDIGGGIGEFTAIAARRCSAGRVFAFEPTPDSFALLEENLQKNGITNATVCRAAIWSSDGAVEIETGNGEPVQFVSQAVLTGSSFPSSRVLAPSLSLSTVFQNCRIERCDLLKLDCEGAEYEILFQTPDKVLSLIDRIVMEYHDNVGRYTHQDMERFLIEKGFNVKICPNVVHSYLGYLSGERIKGTVRE